MTSRNIHVLPAGDHGWAVAVEGTDGATTHYPSQEEAIAAGTEKARQDGVELFIHDRDGQIRKRNEPRHIRG
ncbi:DUF2188 domain-containing protein [Cupriavidus necator]|uniref:DUF2188 domain-containing protein n=1 Tax=Cupriavidus necator TaxID=106590 RepID=UPI0039C0E890